MVRKIIYSAFSISSTVLLFLGLLNNSCKQQRPRNISHSLLDQNISIKIDSIGDDHITKGKLQGMSIAIAKAGEVVYEKAFGYNDLAKRTPLTKDHIFLLASISKLMEAVLIMNLVEEGKLSLNNTLYDLLPDFPNSEQAKKISIKHLLNHTSGLAEYSTVIDSTFVKSYRNPTKEDFYSFFRHSELMFTPGTNYSYSNSGYLLLGMIVERITNNSFQSEIDRVINKPTDFNMTLISKNINNNKMVTYFELKDSILKPLKHWTWIKGDGGLTTTASELAKFPFLWKERKIISAESFDQMIQPTLLSSTILSDYGMGVILGEFEGEKIVGHSGGHKSIKSIMVYFPDKELSIVVMVNTDNTSSNAGNIFGEIALAVLNKEVPSFQNNEQHSEELSKYEGVYYTNASKFDKAIYISHNIENDHLYYNWVENETGERLINLDNGIFWTENWPLDRIVFQMNDKNEPIAIREYYNGFYAVLRKRLLKE